MGTWLRNLNGYHRSYRQHITFGELAREYPQLRRPRAGALVPDPWDDIARHDCDDRNWKRHRVTAYRMKAAPRPRQARASVSYDSPWHETRQFWHRGMLRQFRVRLAYRRHKLSADSILPGKPANSSLTS